jgi:hypothetical protein
MLNGFRLHARKRHRVSSNLHKLFLWGLGEACPPSQKDMRKQLPKVAKTPIHNSKVSGYLTFGEIFNKAEKKAFQKEVTKKYNFAFVQQNRSKKAQAKIFNQYPIRWQRKIVRRIWLNCRAALKAKPKANKRFTYDQYINSNLWKRRKDLFYQKYGKRCAICRSAQFVHLHHMKYLKFDGKEKDEHLVALCNTHHDEYHAKHGTQHDMVESTKSFIAGQVVSYPQVVA